MKSFPYVFDKFDQKLLLFQKKIVCYIETVVVLPLACA